jgi:hypothetical protein
MKANIGFFPGLIKTRRALSVHQDLDNDHSILVLDSPFLEAVLAGKELDSITPLQWMQAGYVFDMPFLSRKGAI